MILCDIFNETGYIFDQEKVRIRVCNLIEEKAKVKTDFELSIYVVDEKIMKELHKKHLETYEATDVLSFPLDYDEKFPDKKCRLGDIVICAEVAEKQSKESNKTLQEEIEDLAEHGTLHLLGYHHDE